MDINSRAFGRDSSTYQSMQRGNEWEHYMYVLKYGRKNGIPINFVYKSGNPIQ